MPDKLPVDYRDYPKAYVGQPKRAPAEEYGDFPDRSKNDAPSGRSESPEEKGTPAVVEKKRSVVWRAKARG